MAWGAVIAVHAFYLLYFLDIKMDWKCQAIKKGWFLAGIGKK